MPLSTRLLGVLAGLLLLTSPAWGYEVYINKVKVTGAIRDMTLEKVNVKFDAQGNLHIDAPGYEIQAPPTPAAAASAVGKYWLILSAQNPGHYQVSIAANGNAVTNVPATSPQYVMDLGAKLKPAGPNSVQITFLPVTSPPPGAAGEAVNVMVGVGSKAADGTLTIDKVLGTAKQNVGLKSAEAKVITFSL